MDSFFASIEENKREIKGEPVVVCVYSGRDKDSGAVSTTNYLARDYGIKSAMPIKIAKKIAKKVEKEEEITFHFLPVDKEYYREISEEIRHQILEEVTDRIEPASIDEFYLDVSDKVNSWHQTEKLAEETQEKIKAKFELTCSVGIAPNKLVVKIASDRKKPEGITLVRPEEVRKFMYSLNLEDIHGIGNKTVDKLSQLGIKTVEQLSKANKKEMIDQFGENLGPQLIKKAQGEGGKRVKEERQKQISRITTLQENSQKFKYIKDYLNKLADDLTERLMDKNLKASKVTLITINTNLKMKTISRSFSAPVNDKELILDSGQDLLKDFLKQGPIKLRRIGLRISEFNENEGQKKLADF